MERVYFVGIGGIGMAALARYYMSKGLPVAGYDRTESALTDELVREGAPEQPEAFLDFRGSRCEAERYYGKYLRESCSRRGEIWGSRKLCGRGQHCRI